MAATAAFYKILFMPLYPRFRSARKLSMIAFSLSMIGACAVAPLTVGLVAFAAELLLAAWRGPLP